MPRIRLAGWIVGALVCGALTARPAAQTPQFNRRAVAASTDDLFDGSQLHEIWIHINTKDWSQLRATFRQNTYYPCDLEWRGMKVYNAGIRSHGQASRSGTKPAFRLDFDRYVTGQEFLGLKSLVLDNLWQDPSMIKERLTMRLYQRVGLPAPREVHARVYIGSRREFAGVYAIVEDIDERFVKRHFGEDAGYLYQYQWLGPYYFEDLGPDLEPYAARFQPRNHETESLIALSGPIREMVRAVNEAHETDLEGALKPYLDLRTLIPHLALENFLSESDGVLGSSGMNNFYLYRFAGAPSPQVLVWDKDQTFTWLDMLPWHNFATNVLSRKIWAVPGLRAAYLSKLVEIAALAGPPAATASSGPDDPSGWLETEALRSYAQIRAAALGDPLKPYSNEQFEDAVEFVTRFTRLRSDFVRRIVAQLAPD